MSIAKREPLVLLGIAFTVGLAVVQSLQGQGIIGEDIAATITAAIDPEGGWLLPLIVTVIGRFLVYSPAKAEELKAEVPPGYVLRDV